MSVLSYVVTPAFFVSFVSSGCATGVVCCCVIFVSRSSLVESGLKELVV